MGRLRSFFINAQLVVLAAVAAVSLGGEALGWSAYAIATGSMEPSVPAGSLAVCAPVEGTLPAAGDVVAYERANTVVVHRVVSVSDDGAFLTCQGDRNEEPDPGAVPVGSLVGRMVLCVPQAGAALSALVGHRTLAIGALVALDVAACFLPGAACSGHRNKRRGKRPVVG
ncbi:signal peptidase I [Atopobiaceae bacterium 24-176]